MQYDGKPYAYWTDRNGTRRYFWAGGNQTDQVLCQCGLDQTCIDPSKKCNCDSILFDISHRIDEGYITDKNILPVSQLNFGRNVKSGQTSRFTLGPFECTGSSKPNSNQFLPTDCKDLFLLGHIHNGFYTVSAASGTKINNIYCDFTQLFDSKQETTPIIIPQGSSQEFKGEINSNNLHYTLRLSYVKETITN